MSIPDIDWIQTVGPLSGLSEDVLGAILHYLYAECLPNNLSEHTTRQIILTVSKIPFEGLSKLTSMCELYLKHIALKQG